jgi:hypothetical protein
MAFTYGQYPTAEVIPTGLSNIVTFSVSKKKKMTEYYYLASDTDTTLYDISTSAQNTEGKATAYGPLASLDVGGTYGAATAVVTSVDRSYTADGPDMVSCSWVLKPA